MPRISRVALLGPYHSRNLGDTAIQMAVVENLVARRPELQIVGVSLDPADTLRSLGLPAFPLSGRGPDTLVADFLGDGGKIICPGRASDRPTSFCALRRIAGFVSSLDLLIISGGGQLDDFWGGAWAHPFTLFVWVGLARLRGAKVAIVGVGLDRLSTRLSRFFALSALRLAHYLSFRDAGTLAGLEKLGLRAPSKLCPDLAFSLDTGRAGAAAPQATGPFVVISPISEDTWSHDSDARHIAYLKQLVAACVWLSQRGIGLRIVCSQAVMDGNTAKHLAGMLQDKHGIHVEVRDAPAVSDYLAQVRDARVVVASRLHASILSLVAGVPVVAVAAQRKVARLMEDAGLADYCVELQNVTATDLIRCIAAALDNELRLRSQVRDCAERFRGALVQTYDDIVELGKV